jgi:protein-disulfide isomerase
MLDSGEMAKEVQDDFIAGQQLGVSGTPAFFINGNLVSGAQPFSVFEQVIEAELSK